jgi:hypothetical protein
MTLPEKLDKLERTVWASFMFDPHRVIGLKFWLREMGGRFAHPAYRRWLDLP